MAYCLTADVQMWIGSWFTLEATSTPTRAQASSLVDMYSAHLDAALTRAGYGTVPATGTTDLLILKEVVSKQAALRCFEIHYGHDNLPQGVRDSLSGWDDFLSKLADGDIWLAGQAPTRRQLGSIQAKVYGSE